MGDWRVGEASMKLEPNEVAVCMLEDEAPDLGGILGRTKRLEKGWLVKRRGSGRSGASTIVWQYTSAPTSRDGALSLRTSLSQLSSRWRHALAGCLWPSIAMCSNTWPPLMHAPVLHMRVCSCALSPKPATCYDLLFRALGGSVDVAIASRDAAQRRQWGMQAELR